jgi:hypothetical protein
VDNPVNGHQMNAIFSRKAGSRGLPICVSLSNSEYIGQRQFGSMMTLSMRETSFRDGIGRILSVCAKKQMRHIDAAAVIAAMQDVQAVGDWSVGQFPGHSMSEMGIAVNADDAVATAVNLAHPRQASVLIGWSDVLLESDGNGHFLGPIVTASGAIPGAALGDAVGLGRELFCAEQAGTLNWHVESPKQVRRAWGGVLPTRPPHYFSKWSHVNARSDANVILAILAVLVIIGILLSLVGSGPVFVP